MNWLSAKTMRRRFLVAFGHAIRVTWPVLSAILGIQLALGLMTGFVEGWSFGDAIYFTFIPASRLVTVISSHGRR